MALFPKKKAAPAAASEEEEFDPIAEEDLAVEDKATVELKTAALKPKGGKGGSGFLMGLLVPAIAVTAIAAFGGMMLGQKTASSIETAIALKDAERAAAAADGHSAVSSKYTGDMVLRPVEAVVTNLAEPADTWIRLETAMVFKEGALENPDVTAGEIRQDILAYLRTVSVARLEGPSALQHLRDDLNERVAIRTGGRVNELVLQTLVIQ